MHDFIEGLKQGFDFFATLHPHVDIGTKLVVTDGFSNLVSITILILLGRWMYFQLKDTYLFRNHLMGKVGAIVFVICLMLAWSSLSVLCLAAFYAYGSLIGFTIAFQNGNRIRTSPFIGAGIIASFWVSVILLWMFKYPLLEYIQLGIIGWLAWNAAHEAIRIIQLNKIEDQILFIVIGGCISLSIFEPVSFNRLLVQVSQGTYFQTKGNVTIAFIFYYLPLLGWILGASGIQFKKRPINSLQRYT